MPLMMAVVMVLSVGAADLEAGALLLAGHIF
jgi:hypothetical protein